MTLTLECLATPHQPAIFANQSSAETDLNEAAPSQASPSPNRPHYGSPRTMGWIGRNDATTLRRQSYTRHRPINGSFRPSPRPSGEPRALQMTANK